MKILILMLLLMTRIIFGISFKYEKSNLKNDFTNLKEKKLEIKKESIYKFGMILGGTILLDIGLKRGVDKIENDFLEGYTDLVNPLGGPFAGVVLLTGYGSGIIIKDEKLQETSFTSIESVLSAGIITAILKHTFGRGRPTINEENNDNGYKFKPFVISEHKDYDSLPSGHSAIAWSMFTPFAERYSKYIYILPASVSFARVYKKKHWTSDILLGSMIGFLTGYTFTKWHNENIEFYGNNIKIKF